MTAKDIKTCSICEIRGFSRASSVRCSCTCQFCEECFRTFHLCQYPTHKRGGTSRTDKAWAWISGNISSLTESTSRVASFEQDQKTKWFGLHVEKSSEDDRVTRLIETTRFSRLVDDSLHHAEDSPPRQFPSITSFVGETGSGKSTLIRSLIYRTTGPDSAGDPEAPVPGVRSGLDSCLATTGEVNLYPDPSTFGTKHPHFLADCEGMLGGEPVAAQHQRDWFKEGRKYLLESKDGKPVDRKTAVMTIYPRFLYIFSDVICMVTRNQKTWADSAVKLLEWSRVGAHNTINQYALPAIIIVLNGPTCENATWISEDQDAVTRDFFTAIEKEINENATLREMAKQHGDKNMMELFQRNFSSVYVHYIPLEGFQTLGNSYTIIPQIDRLAQRILKHSTEVQKQRQKTWTLFDSKELSVVFDYAFKHLAKGKDRPFDFNQCRQQMTLPVTTEGNFAEFISHCFKNGLGDVFHAVAAVMGFCIVRNSLKVQGTSKSIISIHSSGNL
ncbi:hypothetical protein BCR34DRAFT_494078 [Clohesyomyces aquaticus]|uniref:Uncharacterized protein n=1 Tax=Clohesyomyces aquaticus TaxID=1231657 RepID=A0A1Y1YT41_9PLEO|nr:hypothetical protein BCR34DRAFT_494078 [Clohesyomyces aquaticus]